jgi:aldose 1-epimerase
LTATIELRAGGARVALAPAIGGAIAAFSLDAEDVLRPMPAEAISRGHVRLAAAYPLIPYSNRIRDARLIVRGVEHELVRNFGDDPNAVHGVGWQSVWRVDRADATSAQLALEHDAARAWPWPFAATQDFTLVARDRGAMLATTMTIRNTGHDAFPFGLGWHPYLPRTAATTLAFNADGVWRNDASMLPVAHVALPPAWNFARAREIGAAALDNVFTGFDGRARLATPGSPLVTTIDADSACRCLVVYAPPARDFVALEPVTHETDAFNREADGATHTGTRWLPPGAAFSCTMRITAARSPSA